MRLKFLNVKAYFIRLILNFAIEKHTPRSMIMKKGLNPSFLLPARFCTSSKIKSTASSYRLFENINWKNVFLFERIAFDCQLLYCRVLHFFEREKLTIVFIKLHNNDSDSTLIFILEYCKFSREKNWFLFFFKTKRWWLRFNFYHHNRVYHVLEREK